MLKRLLLLPFACLLLGVLLPAQAQALKLGVVSLDRIIKESAPAVKATQALQNEFKNRERDINDMGTKLKSLNDKLDRDGAVSTEADKQKMRREIADLDREFQRKRAEFQEDLNMRRNEELSKLLERASRLVKEIGVNGHYDIIFQENVVYADPKVDITDQVLKALADSK